MRAVQRNSIVTRRFCFFQKFSIIFLTNCALGLTFAWLTKFDAAEKCSIVTLYPSIDTGSIWPLRSSFIQENPSYTMHDQLDMRKGFLIFCRDLQLAQLIRLELLVVEDERKLDLDRWQYRRLGLISNESKYPRVCIETRGYMRNRWGTCFFVRSQPVRDQQQQEQHREEEREEPAGDHVALASFGFSRSLLPPYSSLSFSLFL